MLDAEQYTNERQKRLPALKELMQKGQQHVCGKNNALLKEVLGFFFLSPSKGLSKMNKAALITEIQKRWTEVERVLIE